MAAEGETQTKSKKIVALLHILESFDEDTTDDDSGDDMLMNATISMITTTIDLSRNKTRRRKRHRQVGYVQNIVDRFRNIEFKIFFRIDRRSFQCLKDWICRVCTDENVVGITERTGSGGSPQTPLHDRLLMTLWFLASKDKYSSIADRFGVSESTANRSILNLLQFINEYLLEKLISWPTVAEQREIKGMFMELNNFPNVVGMIDGTHIRIDQPRVRGIDYYNRKDYYSVVLQAVCREDMRFTNIFVGFPGKVHDARVFKNSPLYDLGANFCGDGQILGDSAYPNINWVLTPFRDNGHLSPSQKLYNIVHAAVRSTIERAFGLMKGRFPRLQHIVQHDIETVVITVLAACVLHNICIMNVDFSEEFLEEDMPQILPQIEDFDPNAQNTGAVKRLAIARSLSNRNN